MPFSQNSGRRTTQWGGSSSVSSVNDPYSSDQLDRQIANARLRAQDSGYDADPDHRNWFEKLTRLPRGQNAFMDTLELIGRPGQAVLNVLDQGVTGDRTIADAAWRGFSGKDRVRGTDIIDHKGHNEDLNPVTRMALGTLIELGTDPTNLIPGGAIAKGVKAVAKPIGQGAKVGLEALDKVSPGFSRFRNDVARPAMTQAKDSLGYMFNRDYKIDETLNGGKSDFLRDASNETENTRRFMQEESVKNIADTARAAGGVDTGVDAGRIMEKPLRQFDEVQMYEHPDGIKLTTSKRELKNEVIGNHQRIKELGTTVREGRRNLDTQITQSARQLDKLDNSIRRMFDSVERKKLRTLKKSDPSILIKPTRVLKGFESKSPAINLLTQKGEEIKSQLDGVRKELGLPRVRKKSYTPEQMQKLATDRAFKTLSPSPAFNLLLKHRNEAKETLDQLRETRKVSGQQEIEDIQKLVDDNVALKESTKNPIMTEREIPRPERELSSSPEIKSAARNLVKSDQSLRQYALDNGIQVPELEGYMTHVWGKAERELRKKAGTAKVDAGRRGIANPNKGLMKERQYKGSVEDINEQSGREIFQPNAYFATAIGQKRLIDYVQAVKFRKDILSNPDFAVKYKKGAQLPPNSEIIDTANYTFLKDDDMLGGIPQTETVGGQYVVTKAAKNALDRFQKLNTDEGTKAFLKAFDTATSFWKKFALFSVGYHIRNAIGGVFNNYVGGMSLYNGDLVKYTGQAAKEVSNAVRGKESALYREYRQQGLSSSALSNVEFVTHGDPEKAIEKTITERSKSAKGKVVDRLKPQRAFTTSREVGDVIDQTNRFAVYKWAREKLNLDPAKAADKVKELQYDYSKLSPTEQQIFARIIPFYRWMRNNIPYQIRQFINDPRKYAAVNKLRLNGQSAAGLNEDNTPEFMKSQFAIPVSGKKYLSLGLPLADLTKLSNPLKTGVDSLNTLIKTPIELATNRNFFYNKPIEQFEGQTEQFRVPGTNFEFQMPIKAAYTLQQGTGQIGRGFTQYLQKPEDVDQDTKFRMPHMGISSVFKGFDAEQSKKYEKMDELKKLQDYLDYIEQQTGVRPRAVKQINP